MSENKKKESLQSFQQLYESIKELLLVTKSRLDDPKPPARPSIADDLHKVAGMAEEFTELRNSRSSKSWSQFADRLDQEGVNLWNISGLVRKTSEDDGRTLVAARLVDFPHSLILGLTTALRNSVRYAAFRLIEAGMEGKPRIEGQLHALQVASKAGATLSEIGRHDVAARVLTSAAKYEDSLRKMGDPNGSHSQDIASATIVYYCSRMEAAWREKNHTVAEFMSQKITVFCDHHVRIDDEQRLSVLEPHFRHLLVSKFYRIGKTILDEPDSKASIAVTWLQKAFSLADQVDSGTVPGIRELKISVLQALARAYFVAGSYDRAEASLEELMPSIDGSTDNAKTEYQELRWLRLATLKRRKTSDSVLLDAFKSIIDHMAFSEANITDILQDLRTLQNQHNLVTAVHQHCLQQAMKCHGAEKDSVPRLLLSLIFHCAKDENHERSSQTVDSVFTSLCQAEIELESVCSTACLTLLWQYGDRQYQAKKWSEAADWFLAGTHQLFRASGVNTSTKCLRKAALCYIEHREFARASTVIRQCPTNEAKTHYVIFLISVHQGLEDEAIGSIRSMVEAPDFDRNMLLLATQISHRFEMKGVLLSVLQSLLETLKLDDIGESVVEAMTLIRCIIRLALGLLGDPTMRKTTLIDTVVHHFQIARDLAVTASVQMTASLISKDISWLWRTAYNSAVEGCSGWDCAEQQIWHLFSIAKQLLEALCKASPVESDPEIYIHLVNAGFASLSGHAFSIRKAILSGELDNVDVTEIASELITFKTEISEIMEKGQIRDSSHTMRLQYFIHTLQIFQAEFLAYSNEWDKLSRAIGEIADSGPLALDTFEAITDILWVNKSCPIDVLHGCLEALLRSSLDHGRLSVEKFSRWLRAICTIILARNTVSDRSKAIGYIEQALSVIEDTSNEDEPYPMDERQWLLATTYNTGAECLHASMLEEAKRWFEASTLLCKHVPGGKDRAQKISETYAHLLGRYGPK